MSVPVAPFGPLASFSIRRRTCPFTSSGPSQLPSRSLVILVLFCGTSNFALALPRQRQRHGSATLREITGDRLSICRQRAGKPGIAGRLGNRKRHGRALDGHLTERKPLGALRRNRDRAVPRAGAFRRKIDFNRELRSGDRTRPVAAGACRRLERQAAPCRRPESDARDQNRAESRPRSMPNHSNPEGVSLMPASRTCYEFRNTIRPDQFSMHRRRPGLPGHVAAVLALPVTSEHDCTRARIAFADSAWYVARLEEPQFFRRARRAVAS